MVEDEPLVSAILPVFNRAGSVTRSIESVLAQTYRHLELIIVDDGSTDSTASIVAGYADRATILTQENGGAYKARNLAANILLLPRFGMMAAAWTTVGSYMLAIVLSVALGRRHVRTPFPPRAAGRTLLACLPLALALLGRNDDSPVVLAWICAGLVFYAVSLSALVWFAAGRPVADRRTG